MKVTHNYTSNYKKKFVAVANCLATAWALTSNELYTTIFFKYYHILCRWSKPNDGYSQLAPIVAAYLQLQKEKSYYKS